MPIVTIEVVTDQKALPDDAAQRLADAIGRGLDSPPGHTWIRLRSLARSQYAENASTLDAGELPVFVTIVQRHAPQGDELEAQIAALTDAVASVLTRPSTCVHIEVASPAAGRWSFGGTLVR
jgi:phenylpyruvate tautomerase PptA (4-oxalocrotonate tautomerase family)